VLMAHLLCSDVQRKPKPMPDISHMLTLEVNVGRDGDAADIEHAATQLRTELLELDVDSVERVSAGDIPSGAKGIEAAALGALIVKWVDSSGLRALAAVLGNWLDRDKNRSIKLRIGGDVLELTGLSPADQSRLIEHWITHHGEH
jgi:hypothetical protein